MKFTFKTEKPTGQWKHFSHDCHYIKYKRKEVGTISHKEPYEIRLMVIKSDINEDGNPNCLWRWIKLKDKFKSLMEAKSFLNTNIESILTKYNMYLHPDS